ncbi:hypothetical protein FC98_GL001174 [Lentilactobacillus kisonensis DSM 19906 = JCM 15041]|uniref:Uncharacterized protein n=2 Tax=Lentilactobacillus kisonensis TaxID=481722 RepID=H1LFQ9_9LACO|nr:hypothetical protein HMPREF9104_01434 [Lentilactobacillus kisonensis F0435]KRL23134.1 hypothetical protein FC98_GL001174 [Lentilactobacillus kisonensis DSM 19906 = JCM 15041]
MTIASGETKMTTANPVMVSKIIERQPAKLLLMSQLILKKAVLKGNKIESNRIILKVPFGCFMDDEL